MCVCVCVIIGEEWKESRKGRAAVSVGCCILPSARKFNLEKAEAMLRAVSCCGGESTVVVCV